MFLLSNPIWEVDAKLGKDFDSWPDHSFAEPRMVTNISESSLVLTLFRSSWRKILIENYYPYLYNNSSKLCFSRLLLLYSFLSFSLLSSGWFIVNHCVDPAVLSHLKFRMNTWYLLWFSCRNKQNWTNRPDVYFDLLTETTNIERMLSRECDLVYTILWGSIFSRNGCYFLSSTMITRARIGRRWHQGILLVTWFNFNPGTDMSPYPL